MMSLATQVDGEFARISELVAGMGGGDHGGSSGSSSVISNQIAEIERLRRENEDLKKEMRDQAKLLQISDRNASLDNQGPSKHQLMAEVARLRTQLDSEREALNIVHKNSSGHKSDSQGTEAAEIEARLRREIASEYESKIKALEKKNAKDHMRMRILRKELDYQSRVTEKTQKALQESQSGLSQFSSGSQLSTGQKLDAIAHQYSDLRRGVDNLMTSSSGFEGASSINAFDKTSFDSEMYQTALPFEQSSSGRRRSMTVSVHRDGAMDVHLGATLSSETGLESQTGNPIEDASTPIGLEDLNE